MVQTESVEAKSKVSLSHTSVELYTNMTKQLKLCGVEKEVTWSTSNSKIAVVLGTKGSNNQIATIRTKGKKGKCKIKATVDGKTYSCTIKVKSDAKISRAKLSKCTKTDDAISIKIKLENKSKTRMYYGERFAVEKFANGSWKEMKLKDGVMFLDTAICLPPESSVVETYTITKDDYVTKFTKGTYRIKVSAYSKSAYNYVLFTLK